MRVKMRFGVIPSRADGEESPAHVRWGSLPFALLRVGMTLLLVAACGGEKKGRVEERVPVTVAVAQQKDVPVDIRAIGSVQPMQTVAVHAQITGQLTQVLFREGDYVANGQLLFVIDPRPYEAALAAAPANLARD